jgi:hypothetical protein
MSKSDAFENALLLMVFQNADIANIGDAGGLQNSTGVGSLYISLHTADPGETGTSITNEVAYTSYARVAVARTAGGFTVSTNQVSLVADAVFPAGTGGAGTATWWGICGGVSTTPASNILLYKGQISPSIVCGNGVTPRLTAGLMVTED